MKVRLATDKDVAVLLLAYRLKRRGILSEIARAKTLQPDVPHWPVWEEVKP